jgi:hypothetical protein
MRLLCASTLALAALLCACGRGDGAGAQTVPLVSGDAPAFLGEIAAAPYQVAYFARRRVWQSYQDANGTETLEYVETVWSDGEGRFSVTPEELLQPVLPAGQAQTFMLLQKAREGFIYRLRDFRIQDLDSFLLAYTVEDLHQPVSVAGQACERLRIRPAHQGPSYWELDVDPATGLILATREFLQSGVLVGLVETLEYQANPNLSGVALHQDLAATPFTPATAQQTLGFTPLQPSFLPQGFALTQSEKLVQGGETWARFSYTNGGETLFLLYSREAPGQATSADQATPYTIKVFRAGRWTVAQARMAQHRIIVLGREPASILQQVIESCAP